MKEQYHKRRKMLRKLFLVSVLCLVLGSMLAIPAMASHPRGADAEVWPTGDPALDLASVQAAIDAAGPGDVILLHATDQNGVLTSFDFGTGGVVISKSLEIRGEIKKGKMTKILNGYDSLLVAGNPEADVTIRGIHLHNATDASIVVYHANDVIITGNRVTADTMKGRTLPLPGTWFDPVQPDDSISYGILVQGSPAYGCAVTGNVIVADNYVDLEEKLEANLADPGFWNFAGKPDQYFKAWEVPQNDAIRDAWSNWTGRWCSVGIAVQSVLGNVRVAGNKIYNPTMRGIMANCNNGDTLVEHNEIVLKLGGYFWGMGNGNIGIYTGTWPPTPGFSPKSITIQYNKIVCLTVPYLPDRTKDSKDKDGIWVVNYGGVQVTEGIIVRQNDITLRDGGYGIFLVDGKGDYVGQNRIRGNGKAALLIGNDPMDSDNAWSPLGTEAITLASNYISSFTSLMADIVFMDDVVNCTLSGNRGTVLFGDGNKINP